MNIKTVVVIVTTLLSALLSVTSAFKLIMNEPFCITNSSCPIPVGKKSNDICCGWMEYDRNGVPLQTVSKCLVVD